MKENNKNLRVLLKKNNIYLSTKKLGREIRHAIKRFFFRRKLHTATPVFVFQMGKVASSSIYHSLNNYPGAVGHGHSINRDKWQAQCLYDWFKEGNSLNIISTIREPIGRNVSEFFQLYDKYTDSKYEKSLLTLEQLKELFITNVDHDIPLTWFDKNIKDLFGIDVYASPFPSSGHISFSRKNINLLIMRFDLDDSIKQELIRDFINFPEYKLKRENVSSNKIYYKTYKEFTNKVKLPENYIEKMCNSKYTRHFFPENEINTIKEKWSNVGAPPKG